MWKALGQAELLGILSALVAGGIVWLCHLNRRDTRQLLMISQWLAFNTLLLFVYLDPDDLGQTAFRFYGPEVLAFTLALLLWFHLTRTSLDWLLRMNLCCAAFTLIALSLSGFLWII